MGFSGVWRLRRQAHAHLNLPQENGPDVELHDASTRHIVGTRQRDPTPAWLRPRRRSPQSIGFMGARLLPSFALLQGPAR